MQVTDDVLVSAMELARAAAVEEAGAEVVGEHLDVAMEGDRLATHLFDCTSPAYRGWRWAVTLARATDDAEPTVCDVVLLPGPDALVAPEWVPWSDRVRPGDLGVGDVLPTTPNDPRLVPGFTDEDALEAIASLSPLSPGAWEIGLGRVRVLSSFGRDEATDRWYEGETGPESQMAKHAALTCATCGFLLTIGGPIGQAFGVCANRMAPADGRVIALDYGCGAHSEVHVEDVTPAVVDVESAESVDAESIDSEEADELGHS